MASHPVRAIELKLSQGAKPSLGGVLPAAKVTPYIAEVRGVPVGEDCISPNQHSAFDTAAYHRLSLALSRCYRRQGMDDKALTTLRASRRYLKRNKAAKSLLGDLDRRVKRLSEKK